jgi:hypothetical protein
VEVLLGSGYGLPGLGRLLLRVLLVRGFPVVLRGLGRRLLDRSEAGGHGGKCCADEDAAEHAQRLPPGGCAVTQTAGQGIELVRLHDESFLV